MVEAQVARGPPQKAYLLGTGVAGAGLMSTVENGNFSAVAYAVAMADTPRLLEPGTAHNIERALRDCHDRRCAAVSMVINIALLTALVGGTWLLCRYRRKAKIDPDVATRRRQVAEGNFFAMLGRHDRRMNNVTGW